MLVQKLSRYAQLPFRASPGAAGYDLFSTQYLVIPAGQRSLVDTGIAIAIQEGYYGRIAPRSGLAVKHSIDVGAGVIDRDYRGEIRVLLINNSGYDYTVCHGERIAQLILEHIATPEVIEVQTLDTTQRAAKGFGSTG